MTRSSLLHHAGPGGWPLLCDGHFYVLYDRGFITCHNARTGEEIYGKRRIKVGSGDFTSSP